ncbi:hypothetical protein [Sphingomonas sp. GC_Shp_3]|uniref:hypothetical protein n=1 Tax=Sphingomonas sp. GC_Shp_3 TaxID=2937383 RepID=UPI00226A58A5|nr:hypothetical protein [Sphingomonas sp. GC_Shp_3]
MADETATTPIVVDPSAVKIQIKGQVRIILAALAGALIGRHVLPSWLGSDTVLDALSALVMIAIASVWQWARVRLQHSRLWQLAINPRVPADLARPAAPAAAPVPDAAPLPDPVPTPAPAGNLLTQGEDPVTLKTFLIEAEDTAIAALKAAGHLIESFAVTECQKLVAQAKTLPVGTIAMNIVSALESHDASGPEKMVALIGAVTPALSILSTSDGLKGLETSVEDFAKEFGQSVFNDFRAASAPLLLTTEQKVAA